MEKEIFRDGQRGYDIELLQDHVDSGARGFLFAGGLKSLTVNRLTVSPARTFLCITGKLGLRSRALLLCTIAMNANRTPCAPVED